MYSISSFHAVPSVTLSPVNITVRESARMVTVQVIRSGDIASRSIVYFNTRSTATGGATGMLMLFHNQLEAKYN